jgi:tetratricopeptide (TPR) repeat protein
MSKRFKTIKKVELEEPRSGKGARSVMMQNVIEGPKPHVLEMIVYGLLILLLMAGTYWRNRVWNSKLELWTDCVKKSPNKDRPHYNLADAFLDLGKYQEAISHLNDALRINPNYAEANNNLGLVLFYQGKYQEAANQYKEALRINPNFAGAHNNLGNAYLMMGNRSLALREYEILKAMNSSLANALYQKIK